MTSVILLVLGTVVGSFLNVVGLRWDEKKINGRSICPFCKKTLRFWELIPVISFIFLKAKCCRCKNSISWQYPLVEIWTGLIFATVPYIFLPIFCIYVVIFIYDFHHKIIPDGLVYTSIVLAFLTSYFLPPTSFSLLDWLAGPILFTFFGLIWLLSRGRAMGFGDAKLGLSVGLLLGASEGFSAIVLAFWIGAVGSLAYLFWDKKLTMKSEIPFAPAIIIGAWLSLVFHLDILYVASF